MKDARTRILVIGDAVAPTGFARVMHSILEPLQEDYEIHQIGTNYHGDPHDYGWKIYPAKLGGDLQGVQRLVPLAKKIQPDLIFLFNDLWVVADYMDGLNTLANKPKIIAYCPIDAGPIHTKLLARCTELDRLVVYTEFAREEVSKALAILRAKDNALSFPPVDVIAHGVDCETFFPRSTDVTEGDDLFSRQTAIDTLYGNDPTLQDAFIVLNANRNQPRKRIDTTIEGFALFAQGKPENVKLHLHMGNEDIGWDIVHLAERHGIEDRLILTTNGKNLPGVSDRQLNLIYQAAAVGINTSVAEGWGLVSFEHAATGAAQIVPRHSACEELWEGAALMLEPVIRLTTPDTLTDGYIVSPEGVATALERLYEDRELLRTMSLAAYARARKPSYRWEAIAEKWRELFNTMLNPALGQEVRAPLPSLPALSPAPSLYPTPQHESAFGSR